MNIIINTAAHEVPVLELSFISRDTVWLVVRCCGLSFLSLLDFISHLSLLDFLCLSALNVLPSTISYKNFEILIPEDKVYL
jgi:hypothetical protein